MAVIDYLPLGTGAAPNVDSQANWAAGLGYRPNGFQPGIASSAQVNKALRQATMIAAAVANVIANQTGLDVLDDGNLATLITNLTAAISSAAGIKTSRIVASSAAMNILTGDYRVGFKRAVTPAATPAALPAGALAGQEFVVEDLQGNFNAFPVTVSAPAGTTFPGNLATAVLNEDRGSWRFTYYGSNIWSIAAA